jgi:uncharacterized membrane protein (DUF106 family)
MGLINAILGKIFDLLLLPFRTLNPWAGMAFISLLTGGLMLFVYRLASNQTAIRAVKGRIKAHLLELRLYKDNMGVTMKAQGQILRANLLYLALNLKPLVVMIVPVVLILAQLNVWFGAEPLAVGRATILKVKLKPDVDVMGTEFVLEAPPEIAVETPPLRVEEPKEVDWRIKPASAGRFELGIRAGASLTHKEISVGGRSLEKVSPLKVKPSLLDEVLYPGEKPLPRDSRVESIEVIHPAKKLAVFGLRLHWLIAYFVLSIIFGFALKKPFRVEI